MDINALIPASLAIPQNFMVFRTLTVLTFFLHFLLVNILLGSAILILILNIYEKITGQKIQKETVKDLINKLPFVLAFTINLGVAPYLFLQVILGSFVYTSSILIGFYWVFIIFTMIISYGLVYFYRLKSEKMKTGTRLVIASVFTLLLIFTAVVFTGNVNLMLSPDKWEIFFKNPYGTFFDLKNPVLYTKMLHTLIGSIAITGLFISILRYYKKEGDYEKNMMFGVKLFASASVLQFFTGALLYYSLPGTVQKDLSGGFYHLLFFGIFLVVISLALVWKKKLVSGSIAFAALFLSMIVMRDMVRFTYIQFFFDPASLEVVKQNGPFVVFLTFLVLCSVLMILVIRKALKDRVEQ